jgi:o-succinylbenzoate---CoA ligase
VTNRPLHAVLIPARASPAELLGPLDAALDGTGPAILPLDATLPGSRLAELIEVLAPATIGSLQDRERVAPAGPAGQASPGVGEDVAVVLPTSGSTGMPKGAELSAGALLASARASLARLGAGPGSRWLCCLPAHHVSGLGVLVRSLVAGSVPLTSARIDAAVVTGATAGGCGYVSLVPTQLGRLLDAGAPVGQFRAILLGGAAAPPELLGRARAAGARVVTTYGMTETCGGCVYDGVPLDGVAVASGADGRVRIGGPVLFSGYRLAPGLTRAALADGWFVTSDLGALAADGRLVVRGRADDVINSGGEKVVAGEVEAALRHCPGVRDVVVLGVADPDWGERVTALIVPDDPASPPGLELLREQVRDRLPRYAAPRGVVHLAEIPLLASGKPDRQLLRAIAAGPGA